MQIDHTIQNFICSVTGRQGGGREIMRDNKCNSDTKQKKIDFRNVIWGETREESLHPRS
jgi:hypothetical protein